MNGLVKRGLGEVREGPCKSFCPCGVGVHYPPSTRMRSPTWELSEPLHLEFLWRLHYVGKIGHW